MIIDLSDLPASVADTYVSHGFTHGLMGVVLFYFLPTALLRRVQIESA